MKKVKIFFVILIAITLYANIGWTVGSYYYKNVLRTPREQLSTLGKIAAGSASFMSQPNNNETLAAIVATCIFCIIWPVGLAFIAASWIIYGCYYALWFIVWGGGAKLLGLA